MTGSIQHSAFSTQSEGDFYPIELPSRTSREARHSSQSAEFITPPEVIEAVHQVLGWIDLDPASSAVANDRVRAKAIYTKETNGLAHPWFGRVWLNPPGGKFPKEHPLSNQSCAQAFWRKLVEEYVSERVDEAIFLGFSLECLQTFQQGYPDLCPMRPLDFPCCIPSSRLSFLQEEEDGTVTVKGAPTHANVIIYLSPRNATRNRDVAESKFRKSFERFGQVIIPS